MDLTNKDKMWETFYNNMAEGKIPYNAKMYNVEEYGSAPEPLQEGNAAPVQLVTPTQMQVEQAKVQLKQRIAAVHRAKGSKRRKPAKRPAKKVKAAKRRKTKKVKKVTKKPGKSTPRRGWKRK